MAGGRAVARSSLSWFRQYTLHLVLALWVLCCSDVARAAFNITLLHTNDVHAHFEQSNAHNSPCKATDAAAGLCYGGVARRYTKVEEIRRSYDNVLLLDAGDQFQGTVWFFLYKGTVASCFMNRLGYDAMTIGNHEFDAGVGSLTTFLRNLTFPVVSANIDASKEPQLAACFTKSTMLNVSGEHIGIVGYTTPDTKVTANPVYVKRIDFLDPIPPIQAEVDKLRAQNVNKIFVLGHGGYLLDQKIAKQVKGIDVVIGGHSHTFLYSGTPPSRDKPKGEYPTVVKQDSGNEVLVVQAYAYGKYLGFLQLEFDDEGKVTSWAGQPILLDSSVTQDPAILRELENYREPLQRFKARDIGRTGVLLEGDDTCRERECSLGNLLTTAIWYENLQPPTLDRWATVSCAVVNSGSFRASIDKGNISVENVLDAMPYRDSLMAVDLEGRYVIEMLEHSVEDYDPDALKGKFLQMSGLKVVYDVTKPNGKRVTEASIRCTECVVPRFEPLLPNKTYTLFVCTYLAGGGDGYAMILQHARNVVPYGNLLSDTLVGYLRRRSTVVQGLDGNIMFKTRLEPTQGPAVAVKEDTSAGHRGDVCLLLLACALILLIA